MKKLIAVLAVFALTLLAAGQYHLLKKCPVPGNGSWDYLTVDPAAHRLYVSHGMQVEVLNADTGAVTGRIDGTKGVHGIALAPEFNKGFTSNGQSDDVTIFDLKTLAVVGHAPAGKKPDAIIYDPATKRVIVNNGGSDNSTIINAADNKVTGAIDLGGGPEFAAADGKGKVFVNLEEKAETLKIDPMTLKVEARWPLAPCKTATAMAMDTATRRIFVGCRSKHMAVLNADTGKVITTMPIGAGVDAAAFDAATKQIYMSCGDGTISVFHEDSPDKYSAVETIQTEPGAKTMALDPKTHKIYLSVAERKDRTVVPDTFHVLIFGR